MAMNVPIVEDYEQELAESWDDIDGQEFGPEMVRNEHALEMEWYRRMNVYEKRAIEECFKKTKKPPVKVNYIHHHKGGRQNMNVMARLVAQQINTGKEQGFVRGHAATRGFADAAVSDAHWEQAQGVNVQ